MSARGLAIVACAAGAAFVALFGVTPGSMAAPVTTTVTAPPAEHQADPALRTHVMRTGPYRVPAYGVIKRTDSVKPPPITGSIVGMDARIVDKNGVPVPQYKVMLHHFLMTNGGVDNSRRDGACPQRPVRERFYGTSEELRAMTFPRGYGYPTDARDVWKMIWMVMNHRGTRPTVYVEYRVTVDPRPRIPVKPYWLSVIPCVSDQQYTVPGGGPAVHAREAQFSLPAGGRIVAIGGHMHGGGLGLRVSQPRCGNRDLFTSLPMYGAAGDPLYDVKPLLHEPDPKSMSWWQSARGWPVVGGEPLSVTSLYEGTQPHMRVMGIAHVYVATDVAAPTGCGAPPTDDAVLGPTFSGGRPLPPAVRLTLATRGKDGKAREISRPGGKTRRLGKTARVRVKLYKFRPANLSVAAGALVRWYFKDRTQHDITAVRAPRGFASQYSRRGKRFWQRLTIPGSYRLYCSLHPTQMSQLIRVRAPGT